MINNQIPMTNLAPQTKNKKLLRVKILGIVNAVIFLFIGEVFIIRGFYFSMNSIEPGKLTNQEGIDSVVVLPTKMIGIEALTTFTLKIVSLQMIIFGIILISVYFFCRHCIKKQLKEIKLESNYRKEKILVTLSSISVAILTLFFLLNKPDYYSEHFYFNRNAPTQEMIKFMDYKILKEFNKNKVVDVIVTYNSDIITAITKRKSNINDDKDIKEAIKRKFIDDYFVLSLGKDNITKVSLCTYYSDSFTAKLTKIGYKKLKKNKYIRSIELQDTNLYDK
ncbi:MAG: hypothetical protein AB1755_00045 [Candidatus Omnitrophota bacterium]